ncbi:MAG: hypothetical protein ACI9MR_003193, partial [Myxococcota bacterium]
MVRSLFRVNGLTGSTKKVVGMQIGAVRSARAAG